MVAYFFIVFVIKINMKTHSLLKLSLITSLIGIYLIILLANTFEPDITKISNINEKMIDEWIKIEGNVTNQKNINDLNILTVYDGTGGIHAIMYKDLGNCKDSHVVILGKIIEYKGEIEIQIEKIYIK